jgi:hypothetical protein
MARFPCQVTHCAISVQTNDGLAALFYCNHTTHALPDDRRPHGTRPTADLKSP